jgi:hypothetical protein
MLMAKESIIDLTKDLYNFMKDELEAMAVSR